MMLQLSFLLLLLPFASQASSRNALESNAATYNILSTSKPSIELVSADFSSPEGSFPEHFPPPEVVPPPHIKPFPPPSPLAPPPHIKPVPPPSPQAPPPHIKPVPPPSPQAPPPHIKPPVFPPPKPSPKTPPPPPPPPAHLPSAKLSELKISKGTLEPKFKPDVYHYSASVSSGVKKITITAGVPESYERLEYTITINSIPVKSGVPSPQLSVGKTGKTVVYEICVSALEHEASTYYLSVHRSKSKWARFGSKFLLALAIILIVAVVAFLGYGIYLCIKSGRMPSFWPFSYFARERGDEYSPVSSGPSNRD